MSDISNVMDTLELRRRCTREDLAAAYLSNGSSERQKVLLTEYRAITKSLAALARTARQFPKAPYVKAPEPTYAIA